MSFVGKQGQMRLVFSSFGGREEIERHSDMVKKGRNCDNDKGESFE